MTTRVDIDMTYSTSPRVLEVREGSVQMLMQDYVDTIRKQEDAFRGMTEPRLTAASGKEPLGGGVEVGITVAAQDLLLAFAPRTTPAETGTVTSAPVSPIASRLVMVDTAADFVAANIQRGSLLINFTDQSVADVIAVDGTDQLQTRLLIEGISNTYTVGDVYKIWNIIQCDARGGNLTAVDDLGAEISPVLPTAFTQILTAASSNATALNNPQIAEIHGGVVREVWLDTSLASNGTGYQQSPYNNLTDAIDYAEANGLSSIVVLDDITLDRNLKNMSIRGIGVPTIDLAGYDLKGSEFHRVKLQGTYTDTIIAQESVLLGGMFLNGFFENCALQGDLICVNAGTVYMKNCASNIPGLGRPTISMSAGGTTLISVRDHFGGLTIKDCDNALDEITVEMGKGSLTFDGSCTNGSMVARTDGKFVDETAGSTVTREAYSYEGWQRLGLDPDNPLTTNDDNSISVGDIQIDAVNGATDTVQTRQP